MKLSKEILVFIMGIFLFSFIDAGTTGVTQSEFSIGDYRCERTSDTAFWVEVRNPSNMVNALENCSLYMNERIELGACCPTSSVLSFCNSNNKCGQGNPSFRCEDYKTDIDCLRDTMGAGVNSASKPALCGSSASFLNTIGNACVNVTSCSCFWNNAQRKCISRESKVMECDCDGCVYDYGSCNYEVTSRVDNCDNAKKNIVFSTNASWIPGTYADAEAMARCVNVVREYPCASSAKLPFFGLYNFIIALGVIFAVYAFKILK